jgi:hypothetical protein
MTSDPVGGIGAGTLCRTLDRIVACLDGLSPQEQLWQPAAPEANGLLAIAHHALSNAADNVLRVIDGQVVPRDRATEFERLPASADELRQRWAALEPRLRRVLEALTMADLPRLVELGWRAPAPILEVTIMAIRHAAEHQGQAELTRDLVLAQRSPTSG